MGRAIVIIAVSALIVGSTCAMIVHYPLPYTPFFWDARFYIFVVLEVCGAIAILRWPQIRVGWQTCSNCRHYPIDSKFRYCPNCGAPRPGTDPIHPALKAVIEQESRPMRLLFIPVMALWLLGVYLRPKIRLFTFVPLVCLLTLNLLNHLQARSRKRVIERKAQGRCIRCNYSLTYNTSGVCPECGLAITWRPVLPDKNRPPLA